MKSFPIFLKNLFKNITIYTPKFINNNIKPSKKPEIFNAENNVFEYKENTSLAMMMEKQYPNEYINQSDLKKHFITTKCIQIVKLRKKDINISIL